MTQYNLKNIDKAIWKAREDDSIGADELFTLYQSLSDDFQENELLSKLDSYVANYPEANKLYLRIAQSLSQD